MDTQMGTLAMLPDSATIIDNTAKAIAAAREKNISVIYIVVGFRPGAPELGTNNKGLSSLKARLANVNMDEFMTIHPGLGQLEREITVVKRGLSAFAGSDLEVVLQAKGIQHLVLTGISTSGVVLSTLRGAADKDFRLTVLADCCADGDEEVHRVLTTKIFPRHADVLTVDEWNGQ